MASPEDFPALPDWLTGGGDVPLPEASFGLADLEAPSFDEPPPMPSDEWPAPEFGAADALAALPPNLDDTLPDFAELARPAPPPDYFAPPAKAAPSLTDTPPPAKVAALPPVTVPAAEDKWQSHAITVTPTLEADDTLIAYRITVRAPADRGYNDCKVTFPLPPGVKQVHASRKPLARKGWLTWLLGPLAPGEAIPLSVKVLRSPGTEGLLGQPKSFEVSHVAAPAAARIEFDANGPPLLLPGEEFRLKVVLANAGDEPAAHVRLRVKDGLGAATEEWTFGTVAAGGRATAEFDLVAGSAGRGEWEITALSDGNAPAVYTWTTDVVASAVSVALVHPPAVRVDGEFDLTLDVANATPVPARGLSLVFEVPEEFAFVGAVGGRFDGSQSRVTWPAGAPRRLLTLRQVVQ